jgi:hypothetical protein
MFMKLKLNYIVFFHFYFCQKWFIVKITQNIIQILLVYTIFTGNVFLILYMFNELHNQIHVITHCNVYSVACCETLGLFL